jgi:hypothetical protein
LLTLRVHSACRANWLPRGDWPLLLSALWDGNTNKYRHQTAMLAFDLATTKGSKQAAVVPSRGLACVKHGPLKWLSFLKSRTCLFILSEHVNQKTFIIKMHVVQRVFVYLHCALAPMWCRLSCGEQLYFQLAAINHWNNFAEMRPRRRFAPCQFFGARAKESEGGKAGAQYNFAFCRAGPKVCCALGAFKKRCFNRRCRLFSINFFLLRLSRSCALSARSQKQPARAYRQDWCWKSLTVASQSDSDAINVGAKLKSALFFVNNESRWFFASAICRPLKSLAQRIADEKHVFFLFIASYGGHWSEYGDYLVWIKVSLK